MKELASLELFAVSELYVVIYELPSGERIVKFEDCTNASPVIYSWCLDMANEWLKSWKEKND